jgi:hypothetical protein
MSTVAPLIAAFRQSDSPDTEANRIRIVPTGSPMTYDLPYSEVTPLPAPDADGFTRIDLSKLEVAAGLDGVYDVGITAVDERKQESSFLIMAEGNFDFSPPSAPTEGRFEDGAA